MRPVRPVRSRLTLFLPRWVCEPRAYLNHFVRGGLHVETERAGERRPRCCFTRDPSVSATTEHTLAWTSCGRLARRSADFRFALRKQACPDSGAALSRFVHL